MAAITCDICGGGLLMDASGDFAVCGSCGMKHTKDRLQAKTQIITQGHAGLAQFAVSYVPSIIPKKFTDNYINDEITKINESIIKIKHRLDQLPEVISSAKNYASQNNAERMKLFRYALETFGKYKEDTAIVTSSSSYKHWEKQEMEWLNRQSDAEREDREKRKLKLELELRKNELEMSLRKPEKERVEAYYLSLLEKKNSIFSKSNLESNVVIGILKELIIEFEKMESYRDTVTLKKECSDLAIKIHYDNMVRWKNELDSSGKATPDDYMALAKEFREARRYADTETLAKECENQAVNLQYNQLLQAKNNASTENEYQYLAQQFRAMNGYANTIELANKCDNKYRVLKEQREKQERIEQERQAKQERIEQERRAEQERIEHRRRTEEKRREAEERERCEIAEKSMRQFWTVFGIVSGAVIGGIVGAFFKTMALTNQAGCLKVFAVGFGILFFVGTSYNIGWGCLGAIVGLLVFAVLVLLAVNLPVTYFFAANLIAGAVIGWLMGSVPKRA